MWPASDGDRPLPRPGTADPALDSQILFGGRPGRLEALLQPGFGDSPFNEPFIIAAALFVFIFTGSHSGYLSRRAMHRIPAFRFGRGFKNHIFGILIPNTG